MTIAAATPKASAPTPVNLSQLKDRAQALRLMGLLAHWDAVQSDAARLAWTGDLVDWEESERARRSLERRLRSARIGRFKPLADFDWDWPKQCDRATVQELMTLSFMADATNVVLVDEVGYLSYSNRHADLLFELISRRYEHKSTVITTNRAFKEWGEVFPNAACTVSLIDRLVHRCEVISIEGESYRLKEARARAEHKAALRSPARTKPAKA